ncbi:MAG: 6-bladed beta-propeller [Nitrospirota bacterium]|nr:6-bladed beta-propeller [Candidatus Aminicenantes bacterium]MDH5202976.1 6-bladed beta-propeller [Nitrospirota bacterium]MDH5742951.1 6-bladed beta-propeller [Candidatus Aminicenantes bacterium]
MKNKTFIFSIILFLFAFIIFISCVQQKTEWQGTIEEVDGVTVVKNPKEPLYGEEVFNLEEELSIGEAEGREEYMFFQINRIAVSNNGDIYALDIRDRHVKVFNKYGEYFKTFGRGGEGPGELFRPRNVVCSAQEKLAAGGMYRISFFSLSGEFLNSVNPTALGIVLFNVDSQGNIVSLCMHFRDEITKFELKKFSPELDEIFTYATAQKPSSRGDGFNPFTPVLRWDLFNNDKVVCGYPEDGYKLKIFDKEGTLVKEIHREYSPEPITENDKNAILKILNMAPETKISAPSVKYPFRRIYSDDEGRIFVQTWRFVNNGEGFYYDIFDSDGKYLSLVPMKFEPVVIKQGKLFTIVKDTDGYQYIKRYKVTWKF